VSAAASSWAPDTILYDLEHFAGLLGPQRAWVAGLVRIRNRLSIERQRFIGCRNDGVLATNLRGPRSLSSGE